MIRVLDLSVEFPAPDSPRRVLDGISLDVAAGEMLVLRGVSGSGKTTLLSVLGGLLRPTSGTAEVDGHPVAKLPDSHAAAFRRNTLGFLHQNHHLLDRLPVRDNVALALIAAGFSPREIQDRVTIALETTGALHLGERIASRLSGGERQRCALARALAGQPRLLLCDEPTANLDQAGRELLLQILQERKSAGVTIVVATHDPLFDTGPGVDRVIHLVDGRIESA